MNETRVGYQIAAAIAEMPAQLKLGNHSELDYLRATGYFQNPELVTESLILKVLRCGQELIDSWLEFSAGQRVDEGWYVVRTSPDSARVGYYSNKSGLDTKVKRFKSLDRAVACYIKNEIESARALA